MHVRRGFRIEGRAQSNINKAAASYFCVQRRYTQHVC